VAEQKNQVKFPWCEENKGRRQSKGESRQMESSASFTWTTAGGEVGNLKSRRRAKSRYTGNVMASPEINTVAEKKESPNVGAERKTAIQCHVRGDWQRARGETGLDASGKMARRARNEEV